MKCTECPHFKILYDPIGEGMEIWGLGRAKCEKNDLYVDFSSKRKLNKLECVEGVYGRTDQPESATNGA